MVYLVLLFAVFMRVWFLRAQDERGFNEFSFDEFEKRMAKEEAGVAAGDGAASDEAEQADMFG